MLASPGLTPGSGDGMAASTSDRPTAAVANQATRRSSAVTVSSVTPGWGAEPGSITDRVINLGPTGNLDADAIGGADGDFAGAHQPALFDAILARAGVGDDAGTARLDGDQRGAERA